MDINLIVKLDWATLSLVERAVGLLSTISHKEDVIMSTLQEIVDDVAAETNTIEGLVVFVQGLKDQIAAIPGITPVMQAQIDGIFAGVEKNKASIVAAMAPGPVSPPPVIVG